MSFTVSSRCENIAWPTRLLSIRLLHSPSRWHSNCQWGEAKPFVIGRFKHRLEINQSQWIVDSRDRWEFPPFLRGHWQSPCTALTTGKCLSLGLCKKTVKEFNSPLREVKYLLPTDVTVNRSITKSSISFHHYFGPKWSRDKECSVIWGWPLAPWMYRCHTSGRQGNCTYRVLNLTTWIRVLWDCVE